ncbi:3-keto-5-aminohexanoate cleavage protein [Cumulibacter soli]|uniref:3-keto-5-aminohexanoate cleavage protein n=1 Tax=Cumulibacter soli TaxID=2546344 RepID=UPI001ABB0811|nr:3-keto-5-aminohexanoate cleavage protein [Cumulibacter soli]
MTNPVIIEVALNGSTTPRINPTVPRAPEDIARQGLECMAAGAAIVHSHPNADNAPDDLQEYVDAWTPIIAERPDALLYPTARFGALHEPVEQSWAHNLELGERGLMRMSLIDPGSVSLGMRPDGSLALGQWDGVYRNSLPDSRYKLEQSAAAGLMPSISIFDPSFLRAAVGFHTAGLLPPGSMIKIFFGQDAMFGLPPTEKALEAYLELLEGTGLPWSAGVLGGDVFADGFAELVVRRGGHLRVGLEDLSTPGERTNLQMTEQAAALLDELGSRPATPTETVRILGGSTA